MICFLYTLSVKSMALTTTSERTPEFVVHSLLKSPTVTIRDTYCQGRCRDRRAEECTTTTQLCELAPVTFLRDGATLAFRQHRLRIDARAQVLVALLRHSLHRNIAEPLDAESLALTLVQRVLGPRTTHAASASIGRQLLVDRVKLVLASDLARRWTLAEIAAEVRGSPAYLTQVFQQA